MNEFQRMLCAKNELENLINELKTKLGLSEEAMMLVIEMISNSSRYKTLIKLSYDMLNNQRKEEAKDGNTNETR